MRAAVACDLGMRARTPEFRRFEASGHFRLRMVAFQSVRSSNVSDLLGCSSALPRGGTRGARLEKKWNTKNKNNRLNPQIKTINGSL